MQIRHFPVVISDCVIQHIDRLQHNFLWKGNETSKIINYLVNYDKVCVVKENGSIGILPS
jgi:hypothetical protein